MKKIYYAFFHMGWSRRTRVSYFSFTVVFFVHRLPTSLARAVYWVSPISILPWSCRDSVNKEHPPLLNKVNPTSGRNRTTGSQEQACLGVYALIHSAAMSPIHCCFSHIDYVSASSFLAPSFLFPKGDNHF